MFSNEKVHRKIPYWQQYPFYQLQFLFRSIYNRQNGQFQRFLKNFHPSLHLAFWSDLLIHVILSKVLLYM